MNPSQLRPTRLHPNKQERKTRVFKIKTTRTTESKILVGRVENYDVLHSISQSNPGLSIGQLLRGDPKAAATSAKRLFGGKSVKHVMAALMAFLPDMLS